MVADANAIAVETFGTPATLKRQDGSDAEEFSGVIMNPAVAEDFTPGSRQGVSVIRLFVSFGAVDPPPEHGDAVVLGGITYAVVEVEADTNGGAVLKLRIT